MIRYFVPLLHQTYLCPRQTYLVPIKTTFSETNLKKKARNINKS
ncbi:hypothetical protein CWATWH8502_2035 [Crocosphaera watsonii WH 8502]|uniref:Uncharacterized protein n=2 Tax=Crocosphaera watsonii TaxID=263511 RepID=T2JSB1_CROWT|nr:hypothetical protein CWATWH8502_2035 [Crocosphaera watsonii WH 8502]CCQ67921.1 hypothetical protein CWATWH0402_3343 [Crocosphaera watsonii WH 0402]